MLEPLGADDCSLGTASAGRRQFSKNCVNVHKRQTQVFDEVYDFSLQAYAVSSAISDPSPGVSEPQGHMNLFFRP